jgi:uncharacterized protein YaiI (UPF0178 family)
VKILVDAEACPVKSETIALAAQFAVPVVLVSNSHHEMPEIPGVETIVVDDHPDEADMKIVNLAASGDVVVTQDYPLASMALGKGARALSPRGKPYTEDNIIPLLESRHRARERRKAGKRTKGPKPFSPADRERFRRALSDLLSEAALDSTGKDRP